MVIPWPGMSHITEGFGVVLTYTQNSKETPSEGTEDPVEIISCWESFQSGENVLLGEIKIKENPKFLKIVHFYNLRHYLFACKDLLW